MSTTEQKQGFTIIEVVLVLAIAGLIFLMVFIALPALQRGQRDTQRRTDLSRFMSQVVSYSTNNAGGVPNTNATLKTFVTGYLQKGEGFKDPKGEDYQVTRTTAAPAAIGDISYMNGRVCNGESFTTVGATARSAAARIFLEGAGTYCQDNQ